MTQVSGEITRIENAPTVFGNDILANIADFDSAQKMFESAGVAVENFEDYGTGFKILDDKNRLVHVPLFLVEWRFNEGKYGDSFVSIAAVSKHGDKFIINDGSTGIRDQLRLVTQQRIAKKHPTPQAGLLVNDGLRRSDYEVDLPDPKTGELKPTPASTFYLAE